MERVLLIYNTDYDEELVASSGVDVSAVEQSARDVCKGLSDFGLHVDIQGVHGDDVADVLGVLQKGCYDVVFNIVESLCGDTRNELVMPALMTLLGGCYTGPDALTIGLCLHKAKCKHVLKGQDIATPDFILIETLEELDDLEFQKTIQELDFPYFLKLAREDASIGIEASNVVVNPVALRKRARELLTRYQQPVLAEQYIEGREVNVTVLGNGKHLHILPLHEISFADMPGDRPHIVSYAAKWDEEHCDYEGTKPVPMTGISTALETRLSDIAKAAFLALGLRDYGRIDLRVDSDGIPWVIDVNPNCDLSPDAGVARAAAHEGTEYAALVGGICRIAWERHSGESRSR